MESSWPLVKLGSYCSKIGSGATPRGGSSVYQESGEICLVRSQNIYNNGFKFDGLVYIDEQAAGKLKNVVLEPHDILLNITGDSVARVCLVDERVLPARVNQHVAIIRPDPSEFDARFLRFYLTTPYAQALLLNLASAGATRNALTKSMIENFEALKPSLSIQSKVADQLEALELKILSNREINQTLEQMAQALFKSWFVDFDPVIDNALSSGTNISDLPEALQHRAEQRKQAQQLSGFKALPDDILSLFPSEFEQTSDLFMGIRGWVPKGWCIEELGALIDFSTGPAFKSKDFSESGVKLSRGDNVKEGFFHWGAKTRYWPEVTPELEKHMLKSGDILIGMDGSKVGKNWVRVSDGDLPCLLVQRVARLRTKGAVGSSYLSVLIGGDTFKQYVENIKTGTTIPHISGGQIKQMKVLSPNDEGVIFQKFESILESNLKRMSNNLSEVDSLTKLRDLLLPKLVSGEIILPIDTKDCA
jgi:type I restriction enzyme S subunit